MSNTAPDAKWQFWIDRGGTFTDIVAKRPDGSLTTHKLLSENPERYRDAAIRGIADLLDAEAVTDIPASNIEAVKMGTTVGTNALLERKGERVLLIVPEGFKDALRLGYQARPRIFDLDIKLPEQLYEQVLEVPERVRADGTVETPLNEQVLRQGLEAAYADGIRACAILFMHGYRYPAHEQAAAKIAQDVGFTQVSVSHEVSALIKLVGRGDTTVVDAYLSPILRRYVEQVAGDLEAAGEDGPRLLFMQSNGGLIEAERFQGKDCILSGPAGGIVGAVETARTHGFDQIITFDMGGTSTDVAHYDGTQGSGYERSFETVVAGVRMRAPMMDIHTVAAGGGSICHFDGSRFRVGPESAGANPGPCSYRRGGPLTVTDCNVMLGKLQADFFPRVFGPGGDEPLDADAVRHRFTELAAEIADKTGDQREPVAVAAGFLRIAIDNMAHAIRQVSVQRGHDVTRYALNSFGGAGGQHACLVADALGIETVLLHPFAGVLSAFGMGLADRRSLREISVEAPLNDETAAKAGKSADDVGEQARQELVEQGVDPADIRLEIRYHLKYAGTDKALPVAAADPATMASAFNDLHRQQFGFTMADRDLIVEMVAVEAIGASGTEVEGDKSASSGNAPAPEPVTVVQVFTEDRYHDTAVFKRDALAAGTQIEGPAILLEDTSTIMVDPGWRAEIRASGAVVINRYQARTAANDVEAGQDADARPDPVLLEVFNNLFMAIAEQMGTTLENTSYSVNIKERLDFSCAVFDAEGGLVANAPHIPVHLGSMGDSVRTIIERRGDGVKPGDVFMLNDPYNGGTHLPDVTVITPVFDEAGTAVLFYVASRGHHADIGGLTPGSMPPMSTHIDDEGVLIDNVQLVDQGTFQEQVVRDLFGGAKYPARNIEQNIGDLKAQIAANEKGVAELTKMVGQFGLSRVRAYMRHVQDNAERLMREVLASLEGGSHTVKLDSGANISVAITVDQAARAATIDFAGTSEQQGSNFNAPAAVCRAAVLYVFRTLIDADIPLNAGCLKPLDIRIPAGSMLNPDYPAAVVAGNVEVSQCVTDCLFGALGVLASAQGTMNNFTFGNDTYQYYETICGGAGAGRTFDGCGGIHTHMTNSRLTDPEVLEARYPVLLERFSLRHGSGGVGKHQGGEGVIRQLRFLEPMRASILSNRRIEPPFGLEGGAPGAPGKTYVQRLDGSQQMLGSTESVDMETGELITIETPGGGGFGV
ncbi:MAG: hydantoinase B/oxoprolinase family protein [Alphaproteobacteria bacterium]|nr:hydantoinase B/oxoprolinase family protein [Alphaproteobacteria bacterium SS10]